MRHLEHFMAGEYPPDHTVLKAAHARGGKTAANRLAAAVNSKKKRHTSSGAQRKCNKAAPSDVYPPSDLYCAGIRDSCWNTLIPWLSR